MAIADADGLKWEITPGDHDEVGPWHEQELTPQVLALLPEGGVFLDVGAHVGHYALRAALKASVVYAVEPNAETAKRLRENAALNDLANVHVLEIAAWNGTGTFTIQRVHDCYVRDGSNRVMPDPPATPAALRGAVWGARLDDALNQYPLRPDRLDLVKIDTEGADIEVLDGMRELIAKHQPVLFIEDHSCYGYYQQSDLLAIIEDLGYQHELVQWGPAEYWRCVPAPVPSAVPARF